MLSEPTMHINAVFICTAERHNERTFWSSWFIWRNN